jgi:hypothetical protein
MQCNTVPLMLYDSLHAVQFAAPAPHTPGHDQDSF